MILGSAFLIILYLILRYIIAWITYLNDLDPRLGDSTWRFTYDYPVIGERDISDLDDKDFVRLRRKKNKIVLLMYSIVFVMFISSMSLLSRDIEDINIIKTIEYINKIVLFFFLLSLTKSLSSRSEISLSPITG